MIKLDSSLENFTGVGPTMLKRFKKLGINNVKDLLFHYPARYDDFSKITTISNLKPQEASTIKGKISLIANRRAKRRRMVITEAMIEDKTDAIKITWFNQVFITKNLKQGDTVYISGKPEYYLNTLQFSNPSYEKASSQTKHTARLVPIYSSTEKLTQKQIRWIVSQAIKHVDLIDDWLPQEIIKQNSLISLPQALKEIHFPQNRKTLEQARQRLKFDELFIIQLKNSFLKQKLNQQKAFKIKFKKDLTKNFVDSLPFKLTNAQRKSAWQILEDLEKPRPMNRLLEGDVGSGKTIVATLAILNVLKNKKQVALMAPTEILAEQHFKNILKLFDKFDFNLALLTRTKKFIGNQKLSKKKIIEKIKSGKIDLVIGTHALLSEKIAFKNLALTIVDEQHRFGVNQRAKIVEEIKQKKVPHFLSMTATPIPRSLALTIFGDLDISILDEMPNNRKPIITKLVEPSNRAKAYQFIKKQIEAGRQIFVVCPLIDPSDKLGVKSVTQEYEKLNQKIFPKISIGLLHGKLKKDDKNQVVQDFLNQKTKILVSTTVIEVGVDIPNASVMMIEGAERFGLAQLHQLRGRVGRASHQSYCFIFTDNNNEKTIQRLRALVNSNNGFDLAEKDLQLRGPGQVYGTLQSGYMPELRIATLNDYAINQQAKNSAETTFQADPKLQTYPKLKTKLVQKISTTHLE